MAAELVAQFHARDAEGRVYPVHAFQSAVVLADGTLAEAPLLTYKLAIGDRVNHLGDDRFMLVQSGIEIVRIP
ncbi:hypothetical protein [Pseudomonas sp. RIT-PI-S]|uniref:hypothetical protein n=1 Tax=Pseudomonas sp. RIT-PI-S TaxID=3035295 RepID=UPI0021D82684|nr:hypothetical protein [Pseudomonas sp. RIT-PI-S]